MDAEDPPAPGGRRVATSWWVAERQHHLLLAEHAYRGSVGGIPWFTNCTGPKVVAPAGEERVSYWARLRCRVAATP